MKKRLLCFITLLTATISAITLTNNVKAATKWNTSKSVTKEENGIKYSAYLTEDGKESWIYQIKLSKKITKLTLPKEINQAKLTRVGFGKELYNKGEDEDAYQNLFGDTIEPWHNCYGDLSNDDKNKQTIETVAIPGTVNQLEIATFSGMKKLKSVVIPEQTASVPAYTFAKCSALSKVTFSKNMNEIDSTAFVKSNQVKTFSCPKANKTFAVKKGMLTTRSGKTLVLVPNKMKKLTIPSSVKEIKANALASFIVALIGVIVPLIGGFLGYALYFHTDFADYQEVLKSVFIGVVLTATSVSITVETLRELGRLKGRVGTTILGAAVIDDILGIIVLTIVTSLKDTSVNPVTVMVKIVLYFIVIGILFFLVSKCKPLIESEGQKRRVTVFALAFCFL